MPLEYSLYLHKFLGGVLLCFREQFYLYVFVLSNKDLFMCPPTLVFSLFIYLCIYFYKGNFSDHNQVHYL